MAAAAYRQLLRSTRIAFQNDHPLRLAARSQARAAFEEKASLSPTSPECAAALTHAADVSQFLLRNLVQGRRVDPEKENEKVKYKLRIHEFTELGDNNTIKGQNNATLKVEGVPCCGQ
ncbi:hypothetical protein K3495_g3388 [Podosphaera aphanis]|nr:hypothetical protein K3495_g3388 [Podosphaera aphanis]